jgi:hypothetical protein
LDNCGRHICRGCFQICWQSRRRQGPLRAALRAGSHLHSAGALHRRDIAAGRLHRGATRRNRGTVEADIATILKPRWVNQIITATLTGDEPATFRLSWRTNHHARAKLEDRLFGKRILFTNRDHWPVADVVAAYRSQSEAGSGN